MRGLTHDEAQGLILSVKSTSRGCRKFSPVEVGKLIDRTLEAGTSVEELVEALSFTGPSMVTRFRRVAALPGDIAFLVGWGKTDAPISFSMAAELAKLSDAELQQKATRKALEEHFSAHEVKHFVQRLRRSKQSVDDAASDIKALKPNVVRHHLIVGAVTSPTLRDKLKNVTQNERDALMKSIMVQLLPNIFFEAKLASDRFMISVADRDARRLGSMETLEQRINTSLSDGARAL